MPLQHFQNVQESVRTMNHGQPSIRLENTLGTATNFLQVGRDFMARQEIMFALVQIGMRIHLEIGWITQNHIHLTSLYTRRHIFQIITDDLHLLFQTIQTDRAFSHICQTLLNLNSQNLCLSTSASK